MSNLLIDESPQTYKPTLASWIGLNEAIFLQQLHYILTTQDNVGKFVDGRKWYRDKPRDFMVKYFPFWDEGTVKRTMANLRADALILVRSDLNKDTQDRSLWYTVHYQAIERLSGPVERILNKSVKRKEARKSRKSKPSSYPDYTKVQIVPLPKVQIVEPVDESTIRTEGQVQIVPTPKDSLPKDSKELTPKGVVGKPPAGAKTIIRDRFLELTGLSMPTSKGDISFWWANFGEILKLARGDPDLACRWEGETVSYMQASHLTITGPKSIVGLIGALASGQTLQKKASQNGTYQNTNRKGIKALEETGESLRDKPTFDKYTGELVYPDGRRVPY